VNQRSLEKQFREKIFVRATRHIDSFMQKIVGGLPHCGIDRSVAPKSQSSNDLMTCNAKRSESMAAAINCEEINARQRMEKIIDRVTPGILPLPEKSFYAESMAVENLSNSSKHPTDDVCLSSIMVAFVSPFMRAEELLLCALSPSEHGERGMQPVLFQERFVSVAPNCGNETNSMRGALLVAPLATRGKKVLRFLANMP
jgi:hypothetical protein